MFDVQYRVAEKSPYTDQYTKGVSLFVVELY
jgi:hypothetical protein